ncbi:hypothetical protein NDU88_003626 [Pleurodeles waltl]|uniref:Uncharacterized protein n=1 Tax=Pleurodeles waltl TaxID=8319 RepID=A0AAV7M559_PLEWA|nr:hypothetical protein NDU88_003626 [Pleurodeles waltl]
MSRRLTSRASLSDSDESEIQCGVVTDGESSYSASRRKFSFSAAARALLCPVTSPQTRAFSFSASEETLPLRAAHSSNGRFCRSARTFSSFELTFSG